MASACSARGRSAGPAGRGERRLPGREPRLRSWPWYSRADASSASTSASASSTWRATGVLGGGAASLSCCCSLASSFSFWPVTVDRDRESATMPMGWAEPSVTKVDRVLTGIAEAGSVAYGTVMKGLFCSRRGPARSDRKGHTAHASGGPTRPDCELGRKPRSSVTALSLHVTVGWEATPGAYHPQSAAPRVLLVGRESERTWWACV